MSLSKKLLSLLLCCLMLLPALLACKTGGETEVTTEPPVTEAPEIPVAIVADGATEYTIIRTDSQKNTGDIAAALKLREGIKNDTGIDVPIKTDWIQRDTTLPEKSKEILVGTTNRPETERARGEIRDKDFIITIENDRVVIIGGSDDATSRAVDYFMEKYVDKETKKITVYENRREIVRFDYPLGDVKIAGVPLADFVIVHPDKCDLITYYVAVNLADYFSANCGRDIKVVSDTTAEAEHEMLVGVTNRSASTAAAATVIPDDEFILTYTDGKVVMLGKSYMVGAAASELVNVHLKSTGVNTDVDAKDIPTAAAGKKFSFPAARSAILMIGDGMGRNHIEATLANGLSSFVADGLPNITTCKTFSQSVTLGKASYTDSAASATALATGYKSINGYIGLDFNKVSRQNVRELADSVGARTAILTTDVITGATPAGFMCHHISRSDTAILQGQIDKLTDDKLIEYAKGSVADTLTDCARDALSLISENGSRYFMMIEEAYTDKGGHNNDMAIVNHAVERLNDCIAYVIGFVMLHPDTALIITADHETGGITKQADGSFTFTSTNHTNRDVPYFTLGGGTAELVASAAVVDNTDTAKFIAKIFGADSFGG